MKRFASLAGLLTLFLVMISANLTAGDVSGKWVGDVNTPDGQTISLTFTFKLDGNKVTGTVGGPMGDMEIAEGKMDGDTLSFGLNVDAGGQQLSFKCTGKLAADDQLKITMNGGGDMTFEVATKRSTT
jgi:hypothetical protein